MNNRSSTVLIVIFVASAIFALVYYIAFGTYYKLLNIALSLLFLNIVFMRVAVFLSRKKMVSAINKSGISGLKPEQLKGLEKVKTIIVSKEKIISTGKYKLMNTEHRFTTSKKSAIETAARLAELWKPAYAKALKKKLKRPLNGIAYQSVEKSEYGISATTDTGSKLMLGFHPFVHQYVDKKDDTTIYLIKNNILNGKFSLREKWDKESIRQIGQLNHLGNLVYIYSAEEDEQAGTLPFDKAYTGLNTEEQKTLIEKLSDRASTVLISTDKELMGVANFDFLLTDIKDENNSCIQLKMSEIYKIKNLIELIKKVHRQSGYALYILLISDIAVFTLLYFAGYLAV